MKLILTEDENGARSLQIDYEDQQPTRSFAEIVESAHEWVQEPFQQEGT